MKEIGPSLAGEIAEIASASPTLLLYRRETLDLLRRRIGFDHGSLASTVAGATGSGLTMSDAELTEKQAAALLEFAPLEIQHMSCGKALDAKSPFSRHRLAQLTAWELYGKPTAMISCISSTPTGAVGLILARTGTARPFPRQAFATLDLAVPILALAERLFATQTFAPVPSWAERVGLTARQREVAELAVRGLTNPEISSVLRCSVTTVRNHLVAVFQKSGATSRSELTFNALTHTSERRKFGGYAHFDRHAGCALPR